MVPPSLKGKELETLILDAAKREEASGTMILFRYGVQGTTFGGKTILLSSLPDFGGVLAGGRQFNIEAKCAAGASFPLASDHFRDRQYSHMARCARMGALSFLMIHFAERRLMSKTDPGMTVAVPVNEKMSFWRFYEAGDARSLSREEALSLGCIVPWVVPPRCRKPLPDLLSFLERYNAPF
jgi:penicillin-binding protein-related factor A (putative recombinase)